MKSFLPLLAAASLAFGACTDTSDAPEAVVGAAVETTATAPTGVVYTVDPAASKVNWKGGKPTGDTHNGTLDVGEGTLEVSGDEITGGAFTIEMASLTDVDMAGSDGQAKLEGHLKSADFFDVEQHPYATFEIVSVEPISGREGMTHELTGNLTLKGTTKSIKVPADVTITADAVEAVTPAFTINRTDWDVKYGSGITGVAQDKLINDDVELKIDVKATKAAPTASNGR